jgi:lysophospholipase L1-like esterase
MRRSPDRFTLACLLCAACATPTPDDETPAPPDDSVDSEVTASGPPLPWTDTPCLDLSRDALYHQETIARWRVQDEEAPAPQGQLVVTGSSSIRRWEHAFRDLAPWGVIQRGVGGAHLTEVAASAPDLVLRHRPAGVLVFAGTNDIATGVSPDQVVIAWRCLVQQVHDALDDVPVVYIGITPTPSRWSQWDLADTANREIERLAGLHPLLGYVDLATPFLQAGEPPDAALFAGDQLHLSAAGYELWTEAILPILAAHLPERTPAPASDLAAGSYVRVDLGPSNPDDGLPAPAVDDFGIHWNRWHPLEGGDQVLAGEALRDLVSTTGQRAGVDLVITGGFRANGLQNGGLGSPDGARLGTLAVPEATVDFFYTETADDPGGLSLTGLDPSATYTLRLFASRADPERRVTRYVVHGAGQQEAALVTSGTGVGEDGQDANQGTLAVLTGLSPDRWGQLHLDVQIAEGRFAYLSLLELEAEVR